MSRCRPHGVEQRNDILLFLGMTIVAFLLFAELAKGDIHGITLLRRVVFDRRRIHNWPGKPRPRGEVRTVGAQDVERGLEGMQTGVLQLAESFRIPHDRKRVKIRTRRLDRMEYKSGDWYMRLFMMKYAARGRTVRDTDGF